MPGTRMTRARRQDEACPHIRYGTKRTSERRRPMAAFGGKADMPIASQIACSRARRGREKALAKGPSTLDLKRIVNEGRS